MTEKSVTLSLIKYWLRLDCPIPPAFPEHHTAYHCWYGGHSFHYQFNLPLCPWHTGTRHDCPPSLFQHPCAGDIHRSSHYLSQTPQLSIYIIQTYSRSGNCNTHARGGSSWAEREPWSAEEWRQHGEERQRVASGGKRNAWIGMRNEFHPP